MLWIGGDGPSERRDGLIVGLRSKVSSPQQKEMLVAGIQADEVVRRLHRLRGSSGGEEGTAQHQVGCNLIGPLVHDLPEQGGCPVVVAGLEGGKAFLVAGEGCRSDKSRAGGKHDVAEGLRGPQSSRAPPADLSGHAEMRSAPKRHPGPCLRGLPVFVAQDSLPRRGRCVIRTPEASSLEEAQRACGPLGSWCQVIERQLKVVAARIWGILPRMGMTPTLLIEAASPIRPAALDRPAALER